MASTLSLRAGTVAVLPFSQAGPAELDWIGESVAESVRESLYSQGLLTLAREDRAEVYRRLAIRPNARLTLASVIKVSQALDAGQVVFGTFEVTSGTGASKGTLKLEGRLLDLAKLKEGPNVFESGPLEDLTRVESRLAWNLLRLLQPSGIPSEEEFVGKQVAIKPDAVERYVRGLMAGPREEKLKLFLQAAKLDEHFSQAAFQLGRIYWEQKEYRSAAEWLSRVQVRDSHYMEAVFFLGLCRFQQGDFWAAERNFQEVSAAVPLNEVFNNLGAAQLRRGLPAANDNFKKALDGDDGDPDYWFNLGYAQWKQNNFADAEKSFGAALQRTPEDRAVKSALTACRNHEPLSAFPEFKERLKFTFEENVLRQLQAELVKKK